MSRRCAHASRLARRTRRVLRALDGIRLARVDLRLPGGKTHHFGRATRSTSPSPPPMPFAPILRSPRLGCAVLRRRRVARDILPVSSRSPSATSSWPAGSRGCPRRAVPAARHAAPGRRPGPTQHPLPLRPRQRPLPAVPDESMTYSCAVFEPGDTLEQARRASCGSIADSLRLQPLDARPRDRLRLDRLRDLRGRRSARGSPASPSRRSSSAWPGPASPQPASATSSISVPGLPRAGAGCHGRSPRSRCSRRSARPSTRRSSPPVTGCSPPTGWPRSR